MGGEETSWGAVLFGAALIGVAALAWFASRRWPLASVVVQFAAASMATRFAVLGPEIGMSGSIVFRLLAAAVALFCLYGAIMQIVAWWRYRDAGPKGGEE